MSVTGWTVAGVVFVGGFIATMVGWRRKQPSAAAMFTVWLLALLAFGATLPSAPTPPFEGGGRLGWGVLLGAGLWLLGASFGVARQSPAWATFFPLLAPLLVRFLAGGDPNPALFGVMISTALAWCLLGWRWHEATALAITLFAFCAALGILFLAPPPQGVLASAWRTTPVWLGIGGWLAILVLTGWRQALGARVSWSGGYILAFAGLLLGAIAAHYWSGAVNLPHLLLPLVIAVAFASAFTAARGLLATRNSLLIWIGLFATAFSLLALMKTQAGGSLKYEYGLAVTALMLSLYTLVMAHREEVEVSEQARASYLVGACLLTLLVLFRLFVKVYPLSTPRADLYTHYSFVGFLLGIAVPAMLSAWWWEDREGEAEPNWWRTLTVGFWAAVAPLALAAVFRVPATAGWLAGGLALILTTFVSRQPSAVSHQPSAISHQFALLPLVFCGVASALPLTPLAEPYSDLPRFTRVWILLIVAGMLVIDLLLGAVVNKMSAKRRSNE